MSSLEVNEKRYIKKHCETVTKPRMFLLVKIVFVILDLNVGEFLEYA